MVKDIYMEMAPGTEGMKTQFKKMWIIIKDEETNKLCYYNTVSEEKHFSKPIGLKLTPEDLKMFEDEKNLEI